VPDAALRVGQGEGDGKILRREMQAIREAGLDGSWLTPARLRQETGLSGIGAIRSAGDGYVDPYRVTLGLASAAHARRAAIFERTLVTRVRSGRKGVEIETEGGAIRAGTIIVASNYPPAPFRPLRRHFTLCDTFRAIVIDQEQPPHIFRRTSDERVLFMGADQPHVAPRAREKTLVQRTGQLMYELSKLYPAMSGIRPEYGWDVPVSTSPDGFLCVGPHRNYPHHLFALGSGHNGVGSAHLAARVLLRHYQGGAEKGDDLLGFARIL
jgi:glycine/D-amino acid oxidase-like deaminating enzyme